MAAVLAAALRAGGIPAPPDGFFDTVIAEVPGRADTVVEAAHAAGIALRRVDADHVGVSCSELTTREHLVAVAAAFGVATSAAGLDELDAATPDALPEPLRRRSEFLTHPVFHQHRSETAMLRYLRRLADKDVALDRGMIPLGSCTMKLNATAEMEPITWPGFAELHPHAPAADAQGTLRLIADLERWLADLTGYAAVSLQPNAGSQGELAGLLAIRGYHRDRGEGHRDVCLIPASAHGTNAASAVMAGMRVVVVACDDNGDVDLADLRAKIAEHGDRLAALMITYPSTHGVYEAGVREVCAAVHEAGGQVYVDGANLNALLGLAKPGEFGGDVSHLNLHKTFCIPHGGGGPGVGPVAVREHLAGYLPDRGGGAVSQAEYGSAGVLPISWAYLRMMGAEGLRRATLVAVAAANYVARRLGEHYPVLYTGPGGFVAHECILDLRPITSTTGVTVDDVAKRLADYGLHAPTMSFPVAGTLMVEPTESENLAELDRFCEEKISIRTEIDRVAAGEWPVEDNPLRGAPHTAACIADKWDHPYARELAAYPTGTTEGKVWPPVRRIDAAYGDRNLVCSCPPIEAYGS
jgi:glycine dehydrogenase